MEISFSSSFKKRFSKKIAKTKLEDLFWLKLQLFINDPFDDILKTHKLSGKLTGLWSFSLDYSIRVVFYFTNDNPKKAILVDIGTHDEVY
ncbi:MAG: type II toxin-antitoxin system RelE/ParE family toxin [Chitinophagaceae bacterium]